MKSAVLPLPFAAAMAAAFAGPAAAQEAPSCPQALAVYSSADEAMALEFGGGPDLSFSLLVKGLDGYYEGFTYPAEGEDGTAGVALDNCPDGDATGDEIDACTVWQGLVRAVDADGNESGLPMPGDKAAGSLLLAGLAAALAERLPELMPGAPDASMDTLTLSACLE